MTPLSTHQKYGVINADPPWDFRIWSARGSGRAASSHYDCPDFSTLAKLPVSTLAAGVLFLWATDPLLPRALELIEAWGFTYKTVGFYWVKLNSAANDDASYFTGLGYWTRANPEQCLLATRGKPKRLAKDVRRLVVDRRREHSREPDCVRERTERLITGPYIELFARKPSPAGMAGATKSAYSTKARSLHDVNLSSSRIYPHVGNRANQTSTLRSRPVWDRQEQHRHRRDASSPNACNATVYPQPVRRAADQLRNIYQCLG
jgi:N6-adenosine-specific RNA methylase IME4